MDVLGLIWRKRFKDEKNCKNFKIAELWKIISYDLQDFNEDKFSDDDFDFSDLVGLSEELEDCVNCPESEENEKTGIVSFLLE